MLHKVDPDLRLRLRTRDQERQASVATPDSVHSIPKVGVIVNFTGALEDLIQAGFEKYLVIENQVEGYKIATGKIALDRLEQLASIGHVRDIEGPRKYHPMLNYSVPDMRGDAVRNGHPAFKGKGVVVGVIDSGLDFRHGAFKNDDGSSRILAIWDQDMRAGPGDPVNPFGSGVVITDFTDPGKVRTRDRDTKHGHGTHVAGIAAGNGKPASCCAQSGTYVGVAPEASIIGVKLINSTQDASGDEVELGENLNLVHAMDFIFHGPGLGKSAVINISLGTNLGPHDGTTQVEMAIDTFVAGTPGQTGRAIVVAAGNHANEQHHVSGTVPGNNHVDIEFNVQDGQSDTAFMELWYARAGTLNVTLTASDKLTTTGVVAHGTHWPPAAHPGVKELATLSIDGTINDQLDRNNHFRIRFGAPTVGNFPKGDGWKLRLTNPNDVPVPFHCWIERDNKVVFLPEVNPPDGTIRSSSDSTISIPATARQAISVANHDNKKDCCNCWPSGDINPTSGRGPVARAPADQPNPKPDIAAPGLEITAPKADACNLSGNCCSCLPDACCCLYRGDEMSGTSMSAPHVAGTIALMLEKNPGLNREFILKHLQQTARPAPPGGTKETWGAGKLDAKAAVDDVPFPIGGGGGGGGGGPTIRHTATQEQSDFVPPALRIVRARLKAIPNGPLIAYVVSGNFSEVRRLINTNRRIATLWHRSHGPAMLRRLIKGAIDEEALPAILCSEQLACLERWLDILHKYGSGRLKDSIDRYRQSIAALLMTPLAEQATGRVEQSV